MGVKHLSLKGLLLGLLRLICLGFTSSDSRPRASDCPSVSAETESGESKPLTLRCALVSWAGGKIPKAWVLVRGFQTS